MANFNVTLLVGVAKGASATWYGSDGSSSGVGTSSSNPIDIQIGDTVTFTRHSSSSGLVRVKLLDIFTSNTDIALTSSAPTAVRTVASGGTTLDTITGSNNGGNRSDYLYIERQGSSGGTDSTPNSFDFTNQTGVTRSSTRVCANGLTVAGMDSGVSATVTISGGTYSKNGGSHTSGSTTAVNGDSFHVSHTSSSSYSTSVTTTLTVGGVSGSFVSTTEAASSSDTTPNAFDFTNQTGVPTSSVVTSANTVTISGLSSGVSVPVEMGYSAGSPQTKLYSKDGGAYTNADTTAVNGTTFKMRHTSLSSYSTTRTTSIIIGGVEGFFASTTEAEVVAITDYISHNYWHKNIRVKSIAHMITTGTLSWTTEATTSSSTTGMNTQITNSTKTMVTTNCTVTGGTGDGATKTVTPTGVGPYKVVLRYVHDTSASDTGKAMTGVIKEFVLSGTVLASGDTVGLKFATMPEPVQYVMFDGLAWSQYVNATYTNTEYRGLGIDGANNYALTRYGPSENTAYQSDHNNRYATFTNVNCTVWSADGTTQNPTNIQSGIAFRIVPTNAGTYSCTGVITTASNLVKTMITTGRADSTTSIRTGYGVQVFKEQEPLYPRLDTGDKAAFFNSYHTGTLSAGSTTTVSVSGIDLSGGDWGISSSPSDIYWKFTQTTTGSINVTRTSSDPSTSGGAGDWELRTYRLNV
jgi:hypothetical protein